MESIPLDSQMWTAVRWKFFGLYGGGFGRIVDPTIMSLLRHRLLFGLKIENMEVCLLQYGKCGSLSSILSHANMKKREKKNSCKSENLRLLGDTDLFDDKLILSMNALTSLTRFKLVVGWLSAYCTI